GGAVDAVAPGLGTDIDQRISDARGRGIENAVRRRDSHGHGIHEDVAVVGSVEIGLATHRRNAHAIAVAADAGHDTRHEMPRLGMAWIAEAERIEVGYRPRTHGENIAHDAAHAGRRTLIGLDV